LKQIATLKSETQALITICSDASALSTLASQLSNAITNNTENDSSVKNDLKALSALSSTKSDDGGPEKMLNSVVDGVKGTIQGVLDSMSPGKSLSTSDKSIIQTKMSTLINTEIETRTRNTNILENEMNTTIENALTNATKTGCLASFNATNELQAGNIIVKNGGKANLEQIVSVDAISKCIVDMQIGTKIVTDALAGTTFENKNTTENKNASASSAVSQADTTVKDEKSSSIMTTILYLGIAGIVVGGLVTIAGVIFYNRKSFGIGVDTVENVINNNLDTTQPEISPETQLGGGKSPTIYLLLSLLLFLVFLYKTSKKVFFIISVILLMYLLYHLK
jgi:hypothetical protein